MSTVEISFNITRRDIVSEQDIINLFSSKGCALAATEMKIDGTVVMKFWKPGDTVQFSKKRVQSDHVPVNKKQRSLY